MTEDNVRLYIEEQMKIINMAGRYGSCDFWDFILDGDKPAKHGEGGEGSSGSDNQEDPNNNAIVAQLGSLDNQW
eukprot:CAMPEP_0173443016 /NCGR_PEP_ID=MMETSP1357-20121228/28757_1 /TAXON_ID=77926 /ORGANISM="Hemiselmis rufescens, Strain PCC563" /LENGTH=73 /DNA_ID=CAMNT_0014408859 /DNA_START=24 /DNA_END=242 /DNA_ORIENTATION=+